MLGGWLTCPLFESKCATAFRAERFLSLQEIEPAGAIPEALGILQVEKSSDHIAKSTKSAPLGALFFCKILISHDF